MDFELSEEQRAIQDTAREFARAEMMPHARDWDENATFPVETLRKAGTRRIVVSVRAIDDAGNTVTASDTVRAR